MYFPYLRGKQFELIALRELVGLPLNPERIIPIIEPVKKNVSSLKTALKALSGANVRVQLVVNTEYGELKGDSESIFTVIKQLKDLGVKTIIPIAIALLHKKALCKEVYPTVVMHWFISIKQTISKR